MTPSEQKTLIVRAFRLAAIQSKTGEELARGGATLEAMLAHAKQLEETVTRIRQGLEQKIVAVGLLDRVKHADAQQRSGVVRIERAKHLTPRVPR